jgi:uncharacterized protein YcfL
MKRLYQPLYIVLLAVLLLVSCDTAKAPPAGRVDQLPPGQYPRNVVLEDFQKELVFGPAVVDPTTEDRPMRVTQPVRNVSGRVLNIQYQFQFFDAQGRPLKTNQGWKFLNLSERDEHFLEGAALDTDAADWRLVVRPAH